MSRLYFKWYRREFCRNLTKSSISSYLVHLSERKDFTQRFKRAFFAQLSLCLYCFQKVTPERTKHRGVAS